MSKKLPTRTLLPADAEPSGKVHIVLHAARKTFLAHGFSAATTDMIQREAGVSKSTVYAYYPNKEALFVAVIEAECRDFVKTVRGITFSPGRIKETLTALARAYLDIVLSESGLSLFRIVVAEAPRFPALAHRFYMAGPNMITSMVERHLASATASGEIDLGDLRQDEAAMVFTNMVRSEPQFYSLTHSDGSSSAQIDRWVELVVATFMRAYGRS